MPRGNQISKEEFSKRFLEKAKAIHGDKYSYDKIEYVDSKTKVCLVCPKHGDFFIKPGEHLNGDRRGCQKCGWEKLGESNSLSHNRFLKKCKRMHGNRYDYIKTIYNRTHSPVIITCRIHGDFVVTPSHHVHDGYGCSMCAKNERTNNQKTPRKEFIHLARKLHGKRVYNYEELKYQGMSRCVSVRCKKHGLFKIQAWQFAHRRGCPSCGKHKGHVQSRLTTEQFIEKSQIVHGDKYDYSKTKYTTTFQKIKITCKKHGPFETRPQTHVRGNGGCRKCQSDHATGFTREGFVKSSVKRGRRGIIYLILGSYKKIPLIKIGITNRSVRSRFNGSWKIDSIRSVEGEPGEIWGLERRIHDMCLHLSGRINIPVQGRTECYPVNCLSEIEGIWTAVLGTTPKVADVGEKAEKG